MCEDLEKHYETAKNYFDKDEDVIIKKCNYSDTIKKLDDFKKLFENSSKEKQKELSQKIFEIAEYITDLEWDR